MSNILIIQGHPDTQETHLCHELISSYISAAKIADHSIKLYNIASIEFPLLRSKEDWEKGKEGTPENLKEIQEALMESDHIVIIYPLWLGTMPALLKGFLEQLLRPGVTITYKKGYPQGLLENKSAHIIITMGMPALIYRFFFFSHSLRNLKRNILNLIGIKKIKCTLIGSVENADKKKQSKWFDKMKKNGKNAT
ncbi:MAG: NAD(P)H-dependent oxidoreductase [Rhodomicrobiaceae bacterium]